MGDGVESHQLGGPTLRRARVNSVWRAVRREAIAGCVQVLRRCVMVESVSVGESAV